MMDLIHGRNGKMWVSFNLRPEDIEAHRTEIEIFYSFVLKNNDSNVMQLQAFIESKGYKLINQTEGHSPSYSYANDEGLIVKAYYFFANNEVSLSFKTHNEESVEALLRRHKSWNEISEMAQYEPYGQVKHD